MVIWFSILKCKQALNIEFTDLSLMFLFISLYLLVVIFDLLGATIHSPFSAMCQSNNTTAWR